MYHNQLRASRFMIALLFASLSASQTTAAEGVLEINQACAEQTGCFPGDTAGFPVTITQPGSYRLTSNLVNTTVVSPHISLASSYITLDLGGFEVSGPVSCIGTPPGCSGGAEGEGITYDVSTRQHLVVRNGTVRGTNAQGILLGERATVEDVHVDDTAGTGILVGSFGTVRRSTVVSATSSGIMAGDVSRIVDNVSMSTGGFGISCGDGCTIADNVASGAISFAILAQDTARVHGNTATDSGAGILVDQGSVIESNSVKGNSGIGINAGPGSLIIGNAVRENSSLALSCFLVDTSEQGFSGYRDNILSQNNGTPGSADSDQGVFRCIPMGTNICGTNTTCP